MKISKNSVVEVTYELYDDQGNAIVHDGEPLTYLHGGYGGTFPKVEAALEGKDVGEQIELTLAPDDHFGEIVWDEFLGIWLVLAYLPPALWTRWGALPCYLAAFLLFRLFDIVKPPPIRQIDRHTPGGLGIMLDDVLAALYALAVLWLAAAVL